MAALARRCRICDGELRPVLSLGSTPLANALVERQEEADRQERYPLDLCVCGECTLVQLGIAVPSDVLFSHYLYMTPRSRTLDAHYHEVKRVLDQELGVLSPSAQVVEMGSNTGLFLEHLRPHVGKVLGIEPAANVAKIAQEEHGIESVVAFFDQKTARRVREEHGPADVFAARHCFAHIDDIREIVRGIGELLAPEGVFYLENAYVVDTIEQNQLDQIYHEHMSYLGVTAVKRLLETFGLRVIHAVREPIHGGSILIFAARQGSARPVNESVGRFLEKERAMMERGDLDRFAERAKETKRALVEMIGELSAAGKVIDTYGATAKGNTLLNYCGIGRDKIRSCLDSTVAKQGRFLPGTGIPIVPEAHIETAPPDYCLLTAWNYEAEILAKQAAYRAKGGKFIVPIPSPRIV